MPPYCGQMTMGMVLSMGDSTALTGVFDYGSISDRVVFLLNSMGEPTGNAAIPDGAEEWYFRMSDSVIEASPEWLPYLVTLDGQEHLLLVLELAASDNDDIGDSGQGGWFPDGFLSLPVPEQHDVHRATAVEYANRLAGLVISVGYGRGTGIYGRDEIVCLVQRGTIAPATLAGRMARGRDVRLYGAV